MKKFIIFIFIFTLLFSAKISYSWDEEAARFFPMAVGNSWTYTKRIYTPPLGCAWPDTSYNYKVSITADTVINSYSYFKFSNGNLLRLDSTTMNVYKWTDSTDCLTDSLLARLNNRVYKCSGSFQLLDTSLIIFAEQVRRSKTFTSIGYSRRLVYGVGLQFDGGCVLEGIIDELNGCVIDGELIGDTTVVPRSYEMMRFLPLSVGNVWVYQSYKHSTIWYCDAYERYSITGTSVIDGKTYYTVDSLIKPFYPECGNDPRVGSRLFKNAYLMIDSSNFNIYSTDSCLIDSLASNKGDVIEVCAALNNPVICDTSTQSIFGITTTAKNFMWQSFEASEVMWYIKDIGLVRYNLYQPGPSTSNMILKGCIIDGILYGDTSTMVGINLISSQIPDKFSLSQNYPNPFNPTTKIKFDVPAISTLGEKVVIIKIYDILGREVKTLVNETLRPGKYEVEFDGRDYSSGVYYYRLSAGDFSSTMKMVLIK